MSDTRIDFLYLNEEDMIKAGVKEMAGCVEAMEEMFKLLKMGDFRMGGPNGNSHGVMMTFPSKSPFPNMPTDGPDRRFMAMPAYLGGKFDMAGMKWYGSNVENKKKGLPRSILMLTLNDKETGAPIAYMSANVLSAYRTGAVPGVGVKYFAKEDSKVVGIIGPGVMSKTAFAATVAVRAGIETVKIKGRSQKSIDGFVQYLNEDFPEIKDIRIVETEEEAVRDCDIVHIATSSPTGDINEYPFIDEAWIKPGAILCCPAAARFDDDFIMNRARTVTDNTLAPAAMYGIFLDPSGGMVALCYLIGMIAMFFTGMSYKIMSQKYPMAGSVYVYVQKGVSPSLGFLTGWSILLDYLLLPATVVIIGSFFANALIPSVPTWAFGILFIAFSTFINVVGVDLMAKASWILFALQMIVIIIFVICVIRLWINGTVNFNAISFYNPGHFEMSGIFQATGVVILSYLGFDAISTLAEETINPEKAVGKAIIASILIIGGIFIVITFFAGLAYPNYQDLDVDTAFIQIVQYVGGTWFTILTTITLVLSFGVATCQASQAAVARVFFAMGRDGVLPKQLGYVSKKYQTPVVAIVFVGLVITPLAIFSSLEIISTLVSFGALVGFILLNIAVIWKFVIKDKDAQKKDVKFILKYLVSPLIGLAVTLWIFTNLGINAHVVGTVWLIVGFLYLVGVTRFFRKPVPQLDIE